MKSVMISIKPKWCEKIASGEKTIEVRKTRPKIDTPFKCYIYCTFPKKPVYTLWLNRGKENRFLADGKVIGHFVCDKIENFTKAFFDEQEPRDTEEITDYLYQSNMTYGELVSYVGLKNFYGWHISDLVIYDKPKSLEMFPTGKIARDCGCGGYMIYDKILTRPPQSWCYVEEKE